jgi:hypothetical protein
MPSACGQGQRDAMLFPAFISNEGLRIASPVVVENLANAKWRRLLERSTVQDEHK